jgi:hypothetical protein
MELAVGDESAVKPRSGVLPVRGDHVLVKTGDEIF